MNEEDGFDEIDYIDDEPEEDWNKPQPLIFAAGDTFSDEDDNEFVVHGYYYYGGGTPVYYLQNTDTNECIEAWVDGDQDIGYIIDPA